MAEQGQNESLEKAFTTKFFCYIGATHQKAMWEKKTKREEKR